ncbi:MAG TPA: hypothetical protein VGQ59_04830 [Cyclobacteriaceae bacterium]|nr:hypothetical protein [Cyclobacteriaceae bacterium]
MTLILLSCQSKKDIVNLKVIKPGMTTQEVLNLIGEPTGKKDDGSKWYYGKETNLVAFIDGTVSYVIIDYSTTDLLHGESTLVDDYKYAYKLDPQLTAEKTNVKITSMGQDIDVITRSVATLEKDSIVCIRVPSEIAGYTMTLYLNKRGKYKGWVQIATPKGVTAKVYSIDGQDLKEIDDITVNTTKFEIGGHVIVRFSYVDVLIDERFAVIEGVVVSELLEPFY